MKMTEFRYIGLLILLSFLFHVSAEFMTYDPPHHPNGYKIMMTNIMPEPVELRCAAMQKRRAVAFQTFFLSQEIHHMFFVHKFDRPFRIRCNYIHNNHTVNGLIFFDSRTRYADMCHNRGELSGCSYQFAGDKMYFGPASGPDIRTVDLSGNIPKEITTSRCAHDDLICESSIAQRAFYSLKQVQSEEAAAASPVGPPPVSL